VDERRARIHDDLRGIIGGELLFEPLERASYAIDAGLYEVDPTGVVVPRTEDDVVSAVRYAAENSLPIHPRGAGTGTGGGSVGPGLVIDFSRYFHRVVAIRHDHVVVEPGVVLDVLNAQLAPLGRRLGPDPPRSAVATVAGLVASDAVGPSSLRYGTTGDHLDEVRVVFVNGETATLGRETWPAFDDEPIDFKSRIVRKLGALVRRNLDLLVRRSRRTPGQPGGLSLAQAASGLGIHLPRLIAGSGGTLALMTELTLRTVPIPGAQSAVLLPFARINDAAEAAVECLDAAPAACELFDWRLIHLAREASPAFREWIAESAEAALVVLCEGDDPDEVARRIDRLATRVARRDRLSAGPVVVHKRVECERMLGLRRVVEPLLMRLRGRARPTRLVDEVAVPQEHLAEMIRRLQAVFREHDVSWTLDAHAGIGRLHPRAFLDLADPRHIERLEPLARSIYEAALDLGGTIGGGCGPARANALRRQFEDLIPVIREIKDAFDPLGLLNPGKLAGDEPALTLDDLRRLPPVPVRAPKPDDATTSGETALTGGAAVSEAGDPVFLPVLRWPEPGPIETAAACNACGACRTREAALRMCPTFRAVRSESATPRAKANLLRQLATGQLDPKLWGTEELKATADLCIHCNLCQRECPSGLDVSSLMLEAKAAFVENHGLSPGDWWISRVEFWSWIASRLPVLSNAVLSSRAGRWLLERLCGLSHLRRLPRVHRTPFTRRAARLGLTRPRPQEPGPRVVYFVDIYANYYDQELAEAVVAVLKKAGVNVHVPPGQRDSGMPALVAGDVDHARELALANLRILGNAVRDGYTVVCSEPTAALMIRQEYLKLTDDLDAALVAENTRDVGQYLLGLAERGQLPSPEQPLRAKVGYHMPCHLRALDVGTPGLDLIRGIPELDVEFIDRGCSGMAGTFGLHRDHFLTSLRAGRGLLSRLGDSDIEIGATECSACRLQMEQGSTKRTLHPIKLLSLGYGLNPALRRQFKNPKARHEIS
jgi:FAD/FMN-containing dehydrogenase/Fe-S oxidoreductase